MPDSETMPVRAAAIVLGCHENTIRNYIANGTLDAVALPSGVRRPTTESVLKRARVSSSAELVDIASRLRDEAELLERRAAVLTEAAARLDREADDA